MDKGEKFLEKEGIEDILMDFDKEGELICCSHLIDKALNEQLTINSVSQQRELLIDFVTWQTYSSNLGITIEDRVDIYLKQKGN